MTTSDNRLANFMLAAMFIIIAIAGALHMQGCVGGELPPQVKNVANRTIDFLQEVLIGLQRSESKLNEVALLAPPAEVSTARASIDAARDAVTRMQRAARDPLGVNARDFIAAQNDLRQAWEQLRATGRGLNIYLGRAPNALLMGNSRLGQPLVLDDPPALTMAPEGAEAPGASPASPSGAQ